MNTAGVVFLVLFLLLVAAGVGWVFFTRIRAQRLGLPPPALTSYIPFLKSSSSASPYGPPQPAPGGIVGWINDRIRMFKNRNNRTAAGAYEGAGSTGAGATAGGRASHRGFGPLDPDEAWDSRVGHEADGYGGPGGYYEEQELGLATPHHGGDTSYGGGGGSYQMNLAATPAAAPTGYGADEDDRRGRPRSRSPGLVAPRGQQNPFDDHAEPSNLSLRGVSPRPIDTVAAKGQQGAGKDDDSPTERRSIFRENV
ncbi:hypothetical protein B0T25DRAFT_217802 [Lasiosphaeria hispida]|uniref:Acid phosphatase-like protein n=1 Tax=Lasiosphaeria hispida TaxID=260671 RepID=A0AAJ0HJL6_9PEZI|nr:hypothetical protein B0T25DRAFT_217802 [Lasiosphaeria hispida]